MFKKTGLIIFIAMMLIIATGCGKVAKESGSSGGGSNPPSSGGSFSVSCLS